MFKDSKAFCSFSVNDLTKARDFYGKVLGLATSATRQGGLELTLGGGGKAFVYEKPDHSPASFTILNFQVPQVERTVAALKERGVKFEQYDQGEMKTDPQGIANCEGQKVAWFKDPAGNFIAVLEEK